VNNSSLIVSPPNIWYLELVLLWPSLPKIAPISRDDYSQPATQNFIYANTN